MADPLPDDTITINFRSQEELEKKLVAILSAFGYEICKERWETYDQVRARYPHLTAAALWNRIYRFPLPFPKKTGGNGKVRVRIQALVVTPALHVALSYDRRSEKQACPGAGQTRRAGEDGEENQRSPSKSAKVLEKSKVRRSAKAEGRLAARSST